MSLVDVRMKTPENSSGVLSIMTAAMTAKSYVLSLMINLVGQGYIRQQFERPYPSPPGNLQSSSHQTGKSSVPGTARLAVS
ncbi:hypothetical protein RSOL_072950, partial [Rhizoctonia solani AG-3 Rhs1AP]